MEKGKCYLVTMSEFETLRGIYISSHLDNENDLVHLFETYEASRYPLYNCHFVDAEEITFEDCHGHIITELCEDLDLNQIITEKQFNDTIQRLKAQNNKIIDSILTTFKL